METNKLPEDFKQRWVAALRSGEYKQGFFRFNGPGGTVCVMEVGRRCVFDGDQTIAHRANWLRNHLGNDEHEKLVEMNDHYKKTFPELATYIEQNL